MINDMDFLFYEDIVNHDYENDEWITIEMFEDDLRNLDNLRMERLSIHSYLIPNNSNQLKMVNSNYSWLSWRDDIMNISKFNSEESLKVEERYFLVNEVKVKQFVWYKDSDERYTISPDFIKRHNLIENKQSNIFEKDGDTIVKFSNPRKIEIKREYLQDYLSYKDMIMIRNYNCKRRVKRDYLETIGKKRDDRTIANNGKYFYIHVAEDEQWWENKGMTDSELKGHHVISSKNI